MSDLTPVRTGGPAAAVTLDVSRADAAFSADTVKADIKSRIFTLATRDFYAEAIPRAKTDILAFRVGLPAGGFALGAIAGLMFAAAPLAPLILGAVMCGGTLYATEGIQNDLKRVVTRSEAEGIKLDAYDDFSAHLQTLVSNAPRRALPGLAAAGRALIEETHQPGNGDILVRIRVRDALKAFVNAAERRQLG